MKKTLAAVITVVVLITAFAGCGSDSGDITVLSREEGSGTRGAFVELFGIEQKNEAGEKVDHTIDTADQTNSTGVMIESVAGNKNAIGYISMGSLKDTVKALKIDGAEATVENIKDGSYKVSRPFNIVTSKEENPLAKDFIDFILSSEGQKIVEENGYISVAEAAVYDGSKPAGKITVAGSSSVSPVMEKLIEAYEKVNTNADIELQTSDSTTGMNSAIEGVSQIGMASRELKSSELEAGLELQVIAMDGIVVVVNPKNTLDGLTTEQVMKIYTGEITVWSELQ